MCDSSDSVKVQVHSQSQTMDIMAMWYVKVATGSPHHHNWRIVLIYYLISPIFVILEVITVDNI